MDYSSIDFKEVINRINFLYKKSKNEGLTEEEKVEQAEIRKYYVGVIKGNIEHSLSNLGDEEVS